MPPDKSVTSQRCQRSTKVRKEEREVKMWRKDGWDGMGGEERRRRANKEEVFTM